MVVFTSRYPISSWIVRMSCPRSSRWMAKEWWKVWGVAGLWMPLACTARRVPFHRGVGVLSGKGMGKFHPALALGQVGLMECTHLPQVLLELAALAGAHHPDTKTPGVSPGPCSSANGTAGRSDRRCSLSRGLLLSQHLLQTLEVLVGDLGLHWAVLGPAH